MLTARIFCVMTGRRIALSAALALRVAASAHAADLTVSSIADALVVDADCTLREALEEAGRVAGGAVYPECGAAAVGGPDRVVFDAAIAGSTIVTATTLLVAGDASTQIDGTGSSMTIDGTAITADPVLRIESDAAVISDLTIRGGFIGLSLSTAATNTVIGGATAAEGNVVREAIRAGVELGGDGHTNILNNVLIDNGEYGLFLSSNGTATVAYNLAGVDSALNAVPNQTGLQIASNALVTVHDNVVSGNTGYGVRIVDSTLVELRANQIGVDPTGATAIPNGSSGIVITGSSEVFIGGSNAADGNVISGNQGDGIIVDGHYPIELQHNRIGTDASGTIAIPNDRHGVRVLATSSIRMRWNVISGNLGYGVELTSGSADLRRNRIGVSAAGAALPNGDGGIWSSTETVLKRNVVAFHGGANDAGIYIAPNGEVAAGSVRNCISGNTIGLYDDTTEDISITESWWGDPTGPSDFGGGLGDPLTVNNALFGVTSYLPVLPSAPARCP